MSTTLLPAIRSRVGDWSTYITTISLRDVTRLIKSPDEIHERRRLSDWIQREAIDTHADAIAKYIKETPQRFLGSLIIGVYDGNPNWTPLNVKFVDDDLNITDEQVDNIEGKLGLLHLSGEEKLFAIDGQHRVAGIKKVVLDDNTEQSILDDEVSAIFVAHNESTVDGKQRTRRLFTTVNKKAKRISKSATIALDEDNGFAIVTRQLIDSHWLFEDQRNHISYTSTGSIPANDTTTITSVVGLYEILKDYYPHRDKKLFESARPNDELLNNYLTDVVRYLDCLLDLCPEYKSVFVEVQHSVSMYRSNDYNHILFRPVGQRAFARAIQLLLHRGESLESAVQSLIGVNLNINSPDWFHILWDPIADNMITNKLVLAETQLLTLAGHQARNPQNARKLEELLLVRSQES